MSLLVKQKLFLFNNELILKGGGWAKLNHFNEDKSGFFCLY